MRNKTLEENSIDLKISVYIYEPEEMRVYCKHCKELLTSVAYSVLVTEYGVIYRGNNGDTNWDSSDYETQSDTYVYSCENCDEELGISLIEVENLLKLSSIERRNLRIFDLS